MALPASLFGLQRQRPQRAPIPNQSVQRIPRWFLRLPDQSIEMSRDFLGRIYAILTV
jgi:hypothetical protein